MSLCPNSSSSTIHKEDTSVVYDIILLKSNIAYRHSYPCHTNTSFKTNVRCQRTSPGIPGCPIMEQWNHYNAVPPPKTKSNSVLFCNFKVRSHFTHKIIIQRTVAALSKSSNISQLSFLCRTRIDLITFNSAANHYLDRYLKTINYT